MMPGRTGEEAQPVNLDEKIGLAQHCETSWFWTCLVWKSPLAVQAAVSGSGGGGAKDPGRR